MGCGCNKVRYYSETSPLLLGTADGSPPVHVRCTVVIMGMRANSEFWATGSDVVTMLSAGWLVAI